MAKQTKTDNGHLLPKLDLRRHFLKKYHADGAARVMDCCQGSGRLWHQLRREFVISSYWGLDLKPKRGRPKLDARSILQYSEWTENVIDLGGGVDTWCLWHALLENVKAPTTVFVTLGRGGRSPIRISGDDLQAIGLSRRMIERLSGARVYGLVNTVIRQRLGQALTHGLQVVEAVEAMGGKNCRMFGVRLNPAALSP